MSPLELIPAATSWRRRLSIHKSSRRDTVRWIESDIFKRDYGEIEGVEIVENPRNMNKEDLIIIVMGPTGAGKSTLIRTVTKKWYDAVEVGHTLQSTTNKVSALRVKFQDNVNVVLVDTPGFDNAARSDLGVLQIIARWLRLIPDWKEEISGIVYLHPITDPCMRSTITKNFDMFQKILGKHLFQNVVIASSMWPRGENQTFGNPPPACASQYTEPHEFVNRERELLKNHWKPMIPDSSRYFRFKGMPDSAWDIFNAVARLQPDIRFNRFALLIRQGLAQLREDPTTDAGERTHIILRDLVASQVRVIEQLEVELLKPAGQDQEVVDALSREFSRLRDEKERYKREMDALDSSCTLILSLVRHQNLRFKLQGALERLTGADAQIVVDFLNKVLENNQGLATDQRRRLLHLFTKTIKSAKVCPQTFLLEGVMCNLSDKPKNGGGFGEIYDGELQGEPICVKAVRLNCVDEKVLRAHAGEFALWAHMSHPNVLPFYGVYLSEEETKRICTVSPWMEGGNLVEYLKRTAYSAASRVPFVVDIAHGLQYLHGQDIIHSDLKARNVLVSSTGRAMLADFGISRVVVTNVPNTKYGGTTNWMAPELHRPDDVPPPTPESDMWAFGCTCYEVMTGKTPFERYQTDPQMIYAVVRGHLNPMELKLDPDRAGIWPLMRRCLDLKPENRPSAEEARRFLQELNHVDNRHPPDVEPIFRFQRLRTSPEIDYDRVLAILQEQIPVEHEAVLASREVPNPGEAPFLRLRGGIFRLCQLGIFEHDGLA